MTKLLSSNIKLTDPISLIKGVGEKQTEGFNDLGIYSIKDLLFYFPRRYDDYSSYSNISDLKPGQVSIRAKLSSIRNRKVRRGLNITEAIASDSSGSIIVVWFNQAYRINNIKPGTEYLLCGNYSLNRNRFSLVNPSIEIASDDQLNNTRIVPVYSAHKTLASWKIRKAVQEALVFSDQVEEEIPEYLISALHLMPIRDAVRQIHFPDSSLNLIAAQTRISFSNLFPLLLANELSSIERKRTKALKVIFNVELAKKFVSELPFKLTDEQRKVIWQIYKDMEQNNPMNRLVEGDVGSGKTVVAVMSAVMALANHYKVAFMAPTELLARQHFDTIFKLLSPLGMEDKLVYLSGSITALKKKESLNKAANLRSCFIVGTHSLLSADIDWSDLALLIIDEQHRFGVAQRLELQKKTGHLPHFLSITATPIPRSLFLSLFNDLDLSQLKQLPNNRLTTETNLVLPSDYDRFYANVNKELEKGNQIFVVSPYIHSRESDDTISVEKLMHIYSKKFSNYNVEMIHGKMGSTDQDVIMKKFVNKEIQILIATTVIEVGVDIANATLMAIYGPEHFGLAQLHQLRGRVGRSNLQSNCYLMLSESLSPPDRLRQFANINDGFKLSELDLEYRGPGAIYGKLQHGKGFNDLSINDQQIINLVKKAINLFMSQGDEVIKYPLLNEKISQAQQITYLN